MVRLVLLALASLSLYASVQASADTLEVNVTSSYRYTVLLEFYSQNYNRSWPGGGEAYLLNDYNEHTYVLRCQTGEKICYGAWSRGDASTYWGVGRNDRRSCTRCCYTCGSDPVSINLTY